MNSVEKNVRNKIVKDEDYLIVRLVTYFITLTFVKCVSDLFVGYQCLLHGSFCVAPAYFDVAAYFDITALIVPSVLNFIVYVVILHLDGNFRLRSRETVMFMSLSCPLGSYVCQLIFDGFRLTRRFSLYSMYIAWNGWGGQLCGGLSSADHVFWYLGVGYDMVGLRERSNTSTLSSAESSVTDRQYFRADRSDSGNTRDAQEAF